MNTPDQYTLRYQRKSKAELIEVIKNDKYLTEAKIASIRELESREELSHELQAIKHKLEAELERVLVQRRNSQRYQTFFPRFIASIIDSIVLWPIGFLLEYLMQIDILFLVLFLTLLNKLMPFMYSIFCHGKYGQTVGKYAMNVIVIDAGEQKGIDFRQAILRDAVPVALMVILFAFSIVLMDYEQSHEDFMSNIDVLLPMIIISSLSFLWSILEILSMLTNEKSRALHDLIAGTVVVRKL